MTHVKRGTSVRKTFDSNFIQVNKWKHHPNKWIKREEGCLREACVWPGEVVTRASEEEIITMLTFSWIIKHSKPFFSSTLVLHFHLWVWGGVEGCFFDSCITADKRDCVSWSSSETSVQSSRGAAAAAL